MCVVEKFRDELTSLINRHGIDSQLGHSDKDLAGMVIRIFSFVEQTIVEPKYVEARGFRSVDESKRRLRIGQKVKTTKLKTKTKNKLQGVLEEIEVTAGITWFTVRLSGHANGAVICMPEDHWEADND